MAPRATTYSSEQKGTTTERKETATHRARPRPWRADGGPHGGVVAETPHRRGRGRIEATIMVKSSPQSC
jgi:hypothetical protein